MAACFDVEQVGGRQGEAQLAISPWLPVAAEADQREARGCRLETRRALLARGPFGLDASPPGLASRLDPATEAERRDTWSRTETVDRSAIR